MYLRLICLISAIIITFVCCVFISKIYNNRQNYYFYLRHSYLSRTTDWEKINLAPTIENSSFVEYHPYIIISGGGGSGDGHKGIIYGDRKNNKNEIKGYGLSK